MTWNDWLNLFLRWTHLIAGIYWIGASFYFIWLDGHLEAPAPGKENVEGELWMVHSGGFYQVERRRIAPGQMPRMLHWFKWEAAITWISGILLLGVVYYMTRGVYLLDPAVSRMTVGQAAGLGFGSIAAAWLVYDMLWSSPLGRRNIVATGLSLTFLGGLSWLLSSRLSGRAAMIHVGAALGTIMVANVWMRILPCQRRMIEATRAGRAADLGEGERAKRRSVHNSYMTFPVLFIMLSNHFPGLYGSRWNWLILGLLILLGIGARHLMIGKGRARFWVAIPMAASLALLAWLASPGPADASAGSLGGPPHRFAEVQAVVAVRCLPCHSMHPADPTFGAAPSGVSFDDPSNIQKLAARIRVRAVETRTMPLGNKTGITEPEREVLRQWIDAGARAN